MTELEPSAIFERPTPAWAKLLLAFNVALAFLGVYLLPIVLLDTLGLGGLSWLDVAGLLEMLEELGDTWGATGVFVKGTVVAILLLPFLLFFLFTIWARRRYGRCELGPDQATFHFAFAPRYGRVSVPLSDISERRETPAGLLLRARGRGPGAPLLFPLLVPVSSGEELARAVEILDTAETVPGSSPPEPTFGRDHVSLSTFLLVVPPGFVLLGVPLSISCIRSQTDDFGIFGIGFLLMLLQGAAFILYTLKVIQPRYGKLHLGADALLVGRRRFTYAELTRVAAAPPYLAFEAGRKREIAWVGDELPEAVARLRQRLEEASAQLAVEERPPAWATPRRRRRTLLGVLALNLLFFASAVTFQLIVPERYELEVAFDEADYCLQLVHADDGQLRFLSIIDLSGDEVERATRLLALLQPQFVLPGLRNRTIDLGLGPGDDVVFDLAEGRGRYLGEPFDLPTETTFHVLGPEGRTRLAASFPLPPRLVPLVKTGGSVDSIPALLETFRDEVDDPGFRDFVDGRTSRRCHDVTGPDGWRLVWGVDHGRVLFAVLAPEDQGLTIRNEVCGHEVQGQNPQWLDSSKRFAIILPAGTVRSSEGPLPGFEPLLAATRRIRAGESVAAATRELAAELWAKTR